MADRKVMRATVAGIALVLLAAPARAQHADRFEDLHAILKPGQTIVVTDDSGREVMGKLLALSPSTLVLDTRTFQPAAIREIRKQDRWWDGLVTGAAIGALPGILAASRAGEPMGALMVIGAAGGVGFAIDAAVPAARLFGARK
jgi:hypothetical protein